MTLFEQVVGWIQYQEIKHNLGEGYTENYVNSWTNYELVLRISEALEVIQSEVKSEDD